MSCFGAPCDCLQPLAAPVADEHVEVWSRRAHVTARLRELCDAERPRWPLPEWPELLEDLMRRLTPTERSALLVRFADGDVVNGATALQRGRSPWLARLLADGELFAVFQPVVNLWTGATHGREALIRGTVAGRELSGGQIVGAAQAHDAEGRVEYLARTLAIEGAGRAIPGGETLFLNFNPTTVYDPEACLDSTFALAEQVGLPLSRICFEVVHTEQFPDVGFLDRILRRLRPRERQALPPYQPPLFGIGGIGQVSLRRLAGGF